MRWYGKPTKCFTKQNAREEIAFESRKWTDILASVGSNRRRYPPRKAKISIRGNGWRSKERHRSRKFRQVPLKREASPVRPLHWPMARARFTGSAIPGCNVVARLGKVGCKVQVLVSHV